MTIVVTCPPRAKRHRHCDDCPYRVQFDAAYWQHKYSPSIIDPTNGLARDITSFQTPAVAIANFAGIAETEKPVGHGDCEGWLWKCFEQDEEIIETPSVAIPTQQTWDPITNPIYVTPWIDPDGGGVGVPALSNMLYDLTTDINLAIGVVKQLCSPALQCKAEVCPPDAPAPSDTSASVADLPCPNAIVRVEFKSKLALCR